MGWPVFEHGQFYVLIFIYMLLSPERQMGRYWEFSRNQHSFRNWGAFFIHLVSLFFVRTDKGIAKSVFSSRLNCLLYVLLNFFRMATSFLASFFHDTFLALVSLRAMYSTVVLN